MSARHQTRTVPAALVAAFGWLVPGGGYLLMRRYLQFVAFLVVILLAAGAGIALHGANLPPRPEELQGLDGLSVLLAKAGTLVKMLAGGPYLLARVCDYSQAFVNGYTHEYGTKLLILAGLLNLLALVDAYNLRKAEQN
jgi:hypothetical protein